VVAETQPISCFRKKEKESGEENNLMLTKPGIHPWEGWTFEVFC